MPPPTIDLLKQWQQNGVLLAFITQLNRTGIVSDEENFGLSSTMVEGWEISCDIFLMTNGYSGGRIKKCVRYFDTKGNISSVYNSERVTAVQAKKYIAKFVTKCA